MKIVSFDLYWNEDLEKNWIISFQWVFFDWKKINYNNKLEDFVHKGALCTKINESDFSFCHNYFSYDLNKIPCIRKHFEDKIDTLLIDSLLNFDKESHNLIKTKNNTPLEDSYNTFLVLEKCIIKFHNLNQNIKNSLYSLLLEEVEYKYFFNFYNELNNFSLKKLNDEEIIDIFINILKNKNLYESESIKVLKYNIKNRLSLSYLLLFLHHWITVVPKYIINNKILNLSNFLYDFFLPIKYKLAEQSIEYLKEFTWFQNFNSKIQEYWIKESLLNTDLLITLSTWWWKSLIYQLPSYVLWKNLWELNIIITPLKALIKDQIDSLHSRWYNDVDFLSWEQSNIERDIVYKRVISWKTKIIFVTPENLRSKKTLELFSNRYIWRVIVDEAHTLILWWQEFRPDYFFIKKFIEDLELNNLNRKINITLLTATAPIDVVNWILDYFSNRKIKLLKSESILKENIKWEVININDKEDKEKILLNLIKELNINKNPSIIFTWTRKNAENLEEILKKNWYNCEYFHAWLSSKTKEIIQNNFISWKINLIIATKAFWMWIDKSNIRYVIHFDLPWNIEDYLQEIWRAWRDWKEAKNIILFSKKEILKKISQIKRNNIKYSNFTSFLRYTKIDKEKIILTPRQIAKKAYIDTKKRNWTTDVKMLLSILEQEKFSGIKILERQYDSTSIIFNKIENKELKESYKLIENDFLLNDMEKEIAKAIIYKIIEQKKSIDLNNLEENFKNDLTENINFSQVNINKVSKKINSLKILWISEKEDFSEIVLEAWIIKKESFRENIFFIYKKRLKQIENFVEEKEKSNFTNRLRDYYLFKNYISKKWSEIINKNNINIIEDFNKNEEIWKLVIKYLFTDNNYKEKKVININEILIFLQKYNSDISISEVKENLLFLDKLDILKIRKWLLVFLTRYTLIFNPKALENDFKEYINSKKFEEEIKNKLEIQKELKINKLIALETLINTLEKRWILEYSNLAEYYFNNSLVTFSKNKIFQK